MGLNKTKKQRYIRAILGLCFGGISLLATLYGYAHYAHYVDNKNANNQIPIWFVNRITIIDNNGNNVPLGVEKTITSALSFNTPVAIHKIAPQELRTKITTLKRIKSAQVQIKKNTRELKITLDLHQPVAILKNKNSSFVLLNEQAQDIGAVSPHDSNYSELNLPVITGAGAKQKLDEAISLWQAIPNVKHKKQITLHRVSNRRWTLEAYPHYPRILLPEKHPVAALTNTCRTNSYTTCFNSDYTFIDIRNPKRLVFQSLLSNNVNIRPRHRPNI